MTAHPIVAIEGVVGVGKSTLIESLCARSPQLVPMRLSRSFRDLRRSLETKPDVSAVAHLGYYLAATAELGARAHAQAQTQPVVVDRYFPSPLGLFTAAGWLDERTVLDLAAPFVAASATADVTLVLTATHETIRLRIETRPVDAGREHAVHERCRVDEGFAMAWHAAIERHANEAGTTVILDTTGLTAQNVLDAAREVLTTRETLDR